MTAFAIDSFSNASFISVAHLVDPFGRPPFLEVISIESLLLPPLMLILLLVLVLIRLVTSLGGIWLD
jgi:hypothetical protein